MHAAPLVALVGNPNAGKSALFNALTGARQKVGNYPGVTVERHSGRLALADGRPVVLVDAANLDNHLRFTLQLIALGLPVVGALNLTDMAERDGLTLDPAVLERELGVPVVATVAVRRRGIDELKTRLAGLVGGPVRLRASDGHIDDDIVTLQRRARTLSAAATVSETPAQRRPHQLDAVLL